MEMNVIMSLLDSGDIIVPSRFYKFIAPNTIRSCDECFRLSGEIFSEFDANMPSLPLHQNCDCYFVEVSLEDYTKQKDFQFGEMMHEKWKFQSEDDKNLWCNSFRKRFGDFIDQYAEKYNIPKELLAGVIANEMLEWKFPDGSIIDGIGGGGVGYAQIAVATALKNGITESRFAIIKKLNTYEGSVEIAAKILRNYLYEFRDSIREDKLGKGFIPSGLYYGVPTRILEKDNLVDLRVPQWLLSSMCAVWNSGIEVIY
ncbi:MAG: hypothetical protein J6R00_05655, partial [Lentisphaeria bacterium]|nr:hypothetical protein [Lentisphaeria bacterium]